MMYRPPGYIGTLPPKVPLTDKQFKWRMGIFTTVMLTILAVTMFFLATMTPAKADALVCVSVNDVISVHKTDDNVVDVETVDNEYYKVSYKDGGKLWLNRATIFCHTIRQHDMTDALEDIAINDAVRSLKEQR